MAKVRDTEHTIAYITGRGILDPNTISFDAWTVVLESTVDLLSPKHLNSFRPAQNIVAVPIVDEVKYKFNSPPARIWLRRPGDSWEFKWRFQYLVCGTRFNRAICDGVWTITQEYLLFSRESEFFILTTTWKARNGTYQFSNDTKNGCLKVRYCDSSAVVGWCMEDQENGPYLLREILENFFDAAEKTKKALKGKLRRVKTQQKALKRRLGAISGIKPGDTVWIIAHTHSNDRDFNNEFVPVLVQVEDVKDGIAVFDREHNRPLHSCFQTEEQCRAACPAPFRDP